MAEKLNVVDGTFAHRSDEELEKAISSVKMGMGKMVEVAGIAPDLADNLSTIHDLLVELKWMRGRLEIARKRRAERANVVGAVEL